MTFQVQSIKKWWFNWSKNGVESKNESKILKFFIFSWLLKNPSEALKNDADTTVRYKMNYHHT